MFINSVWAVPMVAVIRLIRPFILVRIGNFRSERVGHFISESSQFIVRTNLESKKTLNLFYLGRISNLQWRLMLQRCDNLKICKGWLKYVDCWNRRLPFGQLHSLNVSGYGRDLDGLFTTNKFSLPFTSTETTTVTTWLKSKGWDEGVPFICLLVRDSNYLRETLHSPVDPNWEYQNYRDSDIQTYIPAIRWLTEQGVWVIRMGVKVNAMLEMEANETVIDLPFDSARSDLIDVWLFSNASGIISTASGPDVLGYVLQIPQLFVNAMPLSALESYSNSIWVPKRLYWRHNRALLSVTEQIKHSYFDTNSYRTAGIEIQDLSENEILEAVQEFWSRTQCKWSESAEDQELQSKFWKEFYDTKLVGMQGWHNPKARVGCSWLAKMQILDS